jgi:hypothetical protein
MKIYVTVYETPDGIDVNAFRTKEAADDHRRETAENNWESVEAHLNEPQLPNADVYFETMGEDDRYAEYFSIHEFEL